MIIGRETSELTVCFFFFFFFFPLLLKLACVEWKPWDVPAGHKIKFVIDDAPVPAPEEEKK